MSNTEMECDKVLQACEKKILKLIDFENGLRGELLKRIPTIFTQQEINNIWEKTGTQTRATELVKILKTKKSEALENFRNALRACGQSRLAGQIVVDEFFTEGHASEAKPSPKFHPNLPTSSPLSEDKRKCLTDNYNELITTLKTDAEFFALLLEKNKFTDNNLAAIREITGQSERNEELLNLLFSCSNGQYDVVCEALNETKQYHIVVNFLTPKVPSETSSTHVTGTNPQTVVNKKKPVDKSKLPSPKSPTDHGKLVKRFRHNTFGSVDRNFLQDFLQKVDKKAAYDCDKRPRGKAIIINNQYFTNLAVRNGAEKDEQSLEYLFSMLQFDTKIYYNLSAEEIDLLLQAESEADHRDHDMFVLFLLSHGVSGQIYGSDSKPVCIKDILTQFDGNHCKSLINKPKIFFIQACQGEIKTEGVAQSDSAQSSQTPVEEMLLRLKLEDDLELSLTLPKPEIEADAILDAVHEKADMAIAYATVDGQVAWRRIDTGSLFVNCILDVFSRKAHTEDLMSMLTEVCSKLHDLEVKASGQNGSFKQISEKRDTLRRKVYLLPDKISDKKPGPGPIEEIPCLVYSSTGNR